MSHLGTTFPSLFGGKLTEMVFDDETTLIPEDKKLVSECKKLSEKDDRPLIMVNINRDNRANSDNKEYAKNVIMSIFPAIGSRIYISGEPESEYWDRVALVRYPSERKFCEMALSEEYVDLSYLYMNHIGLK